MKERELKLRSFDSTEIELTIKLISVLNESYKLISNDDISDMIIGLADGITKSTYVKVEKGNSITLPDGEFPFLNYKLVVKDGVIINLEYLKDDSESKG